MGSVTIELPEDILIDALSHLPYKKRLEIWEKSEAGSAIDIKWLKPEKLDRLTGITSLGGDAVIDSEKIFDE